jgi:membrane protease YdiL (CAAX protease family)
MNINVRLTRLFLLFILFPCLLFFLTSLVFSFMFVKFHKDYAAASTAVSNAMPYVLMVNHTIIFLILLYFLNKDNLSLRDIGFKLEKGFPSAIFQIIMGIGSGGIIYGISHYIFDPLILHFGFHSGTFNPGKNFPLVAFFVGTTLFAGIVEESVYRGYALTLLEKKFNKSLALFISSFFFSLIHFGLGFEGILNAFFVGFLLGVLYFWKRNLILNAVAHAAFNVIDLLLTFR